MSSSGPLQWRPSCRQWEARGPSTPAGRPGAGPSPAPAVQAAAVTHAGLGCLCLRGAALHCGFGSHRVGDSVSFSLWLAV